MNVSIRTMFEYIKQAVEECADDIQRTLIHNLPKASGNLKNNTTTETSGNSSSDAAQYHVDLVTTDYFKYVDKGRKPGKQPPLKAIEE